MISLLINFAVLLIVSAVVGLIALYYYFQKQFKYWEERNVPHTKPSFPFGNLGSANKQPIGMVLKEIYDEGKELPYYGYWQLHKPTLMINDPELIKRVLVGDFMNFHDHGTYFNEKDDPLSGEYEKSKNFCQ